MPNAPHRPVTRSTPVVGLLLLKIVLFGSCVGGLYWDHQRKAQRKADEAAALRASDPCTHDRDLVERTHPALAALRARHEAEMNERDYQAEMEKSVLAVNARFGKVDPVKALKDQSEKGLRSLDSDLALMRRQHKEWDALCTQLVRQ